ncbi:hypothetical protein NA57DRAFT_73674 [Rhizodiscina lignyota]|uniref:Uncharacterized protein n=1 Tax=Rhizodiscina lignyota TaxID=1504668 RepID=A0A9P4ILQ0_9PEZI|nr:hypothetical protein NA57DRAFT_73674 [Rhizodiscina lignyota]
MRFSAITAAALFGASALAAPAPNAAIQKEIQTLEITIVNVLNDIVQLNKAGLHKDYSTGTSEFGQIISQVSGPQPCSPFVPGKPTTAAGAVSYLQKAQSGLQELSLDLMDPSKSAKKGDFHADVCGAWGFYAGVQTFVNKQ